MNDIPDRIHQNLIRTIVKGLSNTPMTLEGGAALLLVYSLDRHSMDIDYAPVPSILPGTQQPGSEGQGPIPQPLLSSLNQPTTPPTLPVQSALPDAELSDLEEIEFIPAFMTLPEDFEEAD